MVYVNRRHSSVTSIIVAKGNNETRNGMQEWNEKFFLEHSAHARAWRMQLHVPTQQLEHKVSSSLGYGEISSSKGEEMNPAVIDLTLQSASSVMQLRGERQYFYPVRVCAAGLCVRSRLFVYIIYVYLYICIYIYYIRYILCF